VLLAGLGQANAHEDSSLPSKARLATDDGLRSEKHPWSYHNGGSWAALGLDSAALELEIPDGTLRDHDRRSV